MSSELFRMAEALVADGDLRGASAEYGRLIDAGANLAQALERRAAIARELGELPCAIADLEAARAADPRNPYPPMRLGQLMGVAGRHIAEARLKQEALDLEPWSFELRIEALAAYMRVGWLDRAYALARTLPEGLPDWWAAARRSAIDRRRIRRQEIRALLRTRHDAADRIMVAWEACRGLFELGRLRVAQALCESLMRKMPASFPAFFFYSRILERMEGPAAAAGFLKGIAWLHRDQAEYPFALARQLHELGDYGEVLFITAHEGIGDQQEELRYIRGTAMLMLGRTDELRRHCRDWMEVDQLSVAPAGFVTGEHYRASAEADAARIALAAGESAGTTGAEPRAVPLVQFWDRTDVPDDVFAVMESWPQRNANLRPARFDEGSAHAFLHDGFGAEIGEAYRLCHHVAMKADLFRIAFLLRHGGVWADADERCLRSVPDLLAATASSVFSAPLAGDTPGYLHNFYLAGRAGSPVFAFALDDALNGIRRMHASGRQPDIWQVTGPGLVTRAAARHVVATDPATAEVHLLPLVQYHGFAKTEGTLRYKRVADANWQLA